MITNIPRVSISGIKYPIYSVDYSRGGADEPSTMEVTFIADTGEYAAPVLNVDSVTNIKVGDFFTFNGYAVRWRKSHSVDGGDSITVKYVDTSIILDKIFIGLHGVHGRNKTNQLKTERGRTYPIPVPDVTGTFNNIILLGTYVDPCEGLTDSYVDPCDNCVDSDDINSVKQDNQSKQINCQTEIYTRILDVTYSFSELLAALGRKGIKYYGLSNVHPNYYGRYTGTAREVLKSWCQELGYTFYWKDDAIVFVDMKMGIIMDDTDFYEPCNLISLSEDQSIENNTYVGNIYYFGAEGRIIENDCSGKNAYRLALQPITLKDIFWAYVNNGGSGSATGLNPYISKYYTNPAGGGDYSDKDSIKGLQLACHVSKYSPHLRDLTILKEFYNVTEISSALVGRRFPLLGIEQIIEVNDFTKEDSSSSTHQAGKIWFQTLDKEHRAFAKKYGARILKIKYNQQLHQRFLDFEKKLADDFIGRYWISFLSNRNYSISAPDGSPEYFKAGSVPAIPFLDLIPESIRGQSVFLKKIIKATKDKNAQEAGKPVVPENQENFALRSGFLLLDRKGIWEPTENSDSLVKFEQGFEQFSPFFIQPFKDQAEQETANSLKADEFYAIMYNPSNRNGFTLDISTSITNHPIEVENKNIPTETGEFGGFNTFYGLRDSHSRVVAISFSQWEDGEKGKTVSMSLYSPVQSYDEFGIQFAGYTVIATPKPLQVLTKSLLPKQEVIVGDCPPPIGDNSFGQDNTTSTTINWRDITSSISSIVEATGGSCGYNVDSIRDVLNEFKSNTARQGSFVEVSKEYEISGFPTRVLSLTDGLAGLTIRISPSNGGMNSTVSFNNYPKMNRSDNVTYKELERNIIRRLGFNTRVSSSNKVNI